MICCGLLAKISVSSMVFKDFQACLRQVSEAAGPGFGKLLGVRLRLYIYVGKGLGSNENIDF